MAKLTIVTARSKAEKKAFMMLPFDIYKNNPYWVSPLLMDMRQMFGLNGVVDGLLGAKGKHPFYEYGQMQLYIAYRNGIAVGRIAAINNDRYNEYHKDEGGVGFFGFFECINDQEVANLLFDTAKVWLKNHRLTKMQGPASPSSSYDFGLLTKGFDDTPRVDMPYQHEYYQHLYTNYGLPCRQELLAYKMDAESIYNNEKLKRGAALVKKRYNVEIRPLNMKDINNEVKKIKEIYNRAWEPLWGIVPLTDAEIDTYAEKFKMIAIPELIPFIYVDGKLAGMAVAVLDFNFILKDLKGKLFPHGYKIFTEKNKIEWMRVILLGIFPEFQGKGIDAVVYKHLIDAGLAHGFKYCEGSYILKENEMMNRGMRAVSAEVYKEYKVYEMDI
jgi:GNAT superfamily N-acetyltransferase